MKRKLGIIVLCFLWISFATAANSVKKVVLDEKDYLLLDVSLNRQVIAGSVDAYKVGEQVVIAIEPLFDSLKLRYQLTESQLKVWKDEEPHIVMLVDQAFSKPNNTSDYQPVWASDGYYQFIDLNLIESIFGVNIDIDLNRQLVIMGQGGYQSIKKDDSSYLFPLQKIELLSERRQSNRFYNPVVASDLDRNTITIADKYSLFTPPQGRINLSANLADGKFNGSMQVVSDLLYHSANLTLSQSNNSDMAASLRLSRYKSSPDDRILGLFDLYHLGDVSGVSNTLTTDSTAGIGVVLQRSPDNYRRKNLEVTIEEIAPPGWDAELFRGGIFLDSSVVPANGRLIYENVELFYGLNDFEIRLYGPYGEEEVIANRINVKQNALAKGQMAYSLNALDKNHRLFNDNDNSPYQITNFGGSFDIGITDRWQLGVSISSIDSDQQFYSIKNALSFNNFLFENDFSVNQEGSYAQKSSITGSIFNKDNYNLIFESAKDFESETISAQDDDFYSLSANYSIPTYIGLTRFGAGVQKSNIAKRNFISNQLSQNIGMFNFTHSLTYSKLDLLSFNSENTTQNNLLGNLSVSAHGLGFVLNANINYDPEIKDPILSSSSIRARKMIEDPLGNQHYVQARYFPLNSSGQRWLISHNVAWQSEDYHLTFFSSYDSNDDWNVNFGLRFFLGFDHRNNRFIMDRDFSAGSATLDVHTYLDRQLNGVPDVLDYNLPDVSFTGSRRWSDYTSNNDGRTILPGVYANSEFSFAGKWQEGSTTYNQDYVVYSHPGAYVDVNMPFYLVTDLTGFVVRQQNNQEIGLRSVQMQLVNAENEIQESVETDQDGYYEFLNLPPNNYTVRVAQDYLVDKAFTSELVGINVATNGKGGYVELPIIVLQRRLQDDEQKEEGFIRHILNEDNVDALVWSDDEKIGRNYFTLPKKGDGKLKAKHSLTHMNPNDKKNDVETIELTLLQENKIENNTIEEKKVEAKVELNGPLTRESMFRKMNDVGNLLPTIKLGKSSKTNQEDTSVGSGSADKMQVNQWVIQFSANKSPVNEEDENRRFSIIGELFKGTKTNDSKDVFYCVLSKNFESKQEAMNVLARSGLSGWINESRYYENVTKIN
jgi:hypothetical protein